MMGWHAVVPIKTLAYGKTRVGLPAGDRASLALAMLRDVLNAVKDCRTISAVHVISEDKRVAAVAREENVPTWQVGGMGGLNIDLRVAVDHIRQTGCAGIAVFLADLPCLTSATVAQVLDYAGDSRQSYVKDLSGRGTTVLLAPQHVPFQPMFGEGSGRKHLQVADSLPCRNEIQAARLDVDTLSALDSAVRFGVGQYTAAWLMAHSTLTAECVRRIDSMPSSRRSSRLATGALDARASPRRRDHPPP